MTKPKFNSEEFKKAIEELCDEALEQLGIECDEANAQLTDVINLSESNHLSYHKKETLDEEYLSLNEKVSQLKLRMDNIESIVRMV